MPAHIKSISASPPPLYPWQRAPKGATTIGVVDPCYGSSHVIYGLDTPRYRHRTLQTLPLRKLDGDVTFFQFTPFIIGGAVPLVHTWNALPLNRDFIVSFELELPRYLGGPSDAQVMRGMRILDSARCKKILALSDFAHRYATQRFEHYGMGHLAQKMDVFRGAVPDPLPAGETIADRAHRPSFAEKPLSAVVIGTQLFRKGGMYAIQAFERLRARGLDVQLTLIGDFETESYAFGESIPDAAEWRGRANGHDWIRFIGPVPNKQVFAELRAHDICVYTSLDESLGWLPIEAAMLGVPVIGAGVCAFPELVGDRTTGWLVEMPLREDGRWAGLQLTGSAKIAALDDANDRVVAGIEECLSSVYDDPALLVRWGTAGRTWATSHYSMAAASERLERIYDEALLHR
jgi:glycosyltransferase involved in cell wall biosynthesis